MCARPTTSIVRTLYDDADKAGLILEVDGDLQGTVTQTTAFTQNYEDQLTEEVKQNFNHPSIIAWSMYNELGNSTYNTNLITTVNNFVHSLDPTRYTTADSDDGSSTNPIDKVTDLLGTHLYGGWYTSGLTSDASFLDSLHNANPTLPVGGHGIRRRRALTNSQSQARSNCRRRIQPTIFIRRMRKANWRSWLIPSLRPAIICGELRCGTCSTSRPAAATKAIRRAKTTKA